MKVYRVTYRDEDDEHKGYKFFTRKSEAEKAHNKNRRDSELESQLDIVDEFDVEISKNGILDILNQLATHPDNG